MRVVPDRIVIVAALVSAVSGWGAVHHARQMIQNSVPVDEGGGWTAALLTEFMVCFTAAGIAIYT